MPELTTGRDPEGSEELCRARSRSVLSQSSLPQQCGFGMEGWGVWCPETWEGAVAFAPGAEGSHPQILPPSVPMPAPRSFLILCPMPGCPASSLYLQPFVPPPSAFPSSSFLKLTHL